METGRKTVLTDRKTVETDSKTVETDRKTVETSRKNEESVLNKCGIKEKKRKLAEKIWKRTENIL